MTGEAHSPCLLTSVVQVGLKDIPLMSATYTVTYVGVHYFVMLKYFDGCHTDPHTVYTIYIHYTTHTHIRSTSVIEQEGYLVSDHTTMHYSTVHSSMEVIL